MSTRLSLPTSIKHRFSARSEPVVIPTIIAGAAFAAAPVAEKPRTNGVVSLDGTEVAVYWDDGDTFYVPSLDLKARLSGYNTLESYGPVHRFGPGEHALYKIASEATALAKSEVWACTTTATEGGYGRKGVDCPDLRRALLEGGLAHVFAVQAGAPQADLDAQARGIAAKNGMWSGGAPKYIVTSVHSLDEKEGAETTYNRVMETATGVASERRHSNIHQACEWVCMEDSCLLYVPYNQRYGSNKAACLK